MDTSDSEHSDIERNNDDDDWVVESVVESEEEEEKPIKKRISRTSVASNTLDTKDSGSLKLDTSGEGIVAVSGVCCSCSKFSSCKTMKCQCRASGGICGTLCGCLPSKCANKGTVLKDLGGSPESESVEGNGSGSGSDETEKSHSLASQGALLLQSALVEKPVEENDDNGPRRKALADIGNKLVCLILPLPNFDKLISIIPLYISLFL